MTEQTRNITDAVIAKNLDDRLTKIKRDNSLNFLTKVDKHLKTLRTLHFYGSTIEEVQTNKGDEFFSTWFDEAEKGDVQAMHSILDHFEPLEIITNMGHNYRCKFTKDSTEVMLDFRPGNIVPEHEYTLNGSALEKSPIDVSVYENQVKAYLYSSILRISKELTLYFPLSKLSFVVNCKPLKMSKEVLTLSKDMLKHFATQDFEEQFTAEFEKML